MTTDPRRCAPSAQRNRDPILEILRRHLPERGLVLEVASGTGEHIVHFAAALPNLIFQPTDPDADARASVDAWVATSGIGNVRPAIALDATTPGWPVVAVDAIVCINMIHIAPWSATVGLIHGAGQCLRPGGLLILYGPYKRAGVHTAASNAAFDDDLRSRNDAWGIRDLEAVMAAATGNAFNDQIIEPMPANNLCLIFKHQ